MQPFLMPMSIVLIATNDSLDLTIAKIDIEKPKFETPFAPIKREEISPITMNETFVSTATAANAIDLLRAQIEQNNRLLMPLQLLSNAQHSLFVQQQLQQLRRKSLLDQQRQALMQIIPQQKPQMMNQRLSQLPIQNQFVFQKNSVSPQQAQIINNGRIVANNLLLNRLRANYAAQLPPRPFFS